MPGDLDVVRRDCRVVRRSVRAYVGCVLAVGACVAVRWSRWAVGCAAAGTHVVDGRCPVMLFGGCGGSELCVAAGRMRVSDTRGRLWAWLSDVERDSWLLSAVMWQCPTGGSQLTMSTWRGVWWSTTTDGGTGRGATSAQRRWRAPYVIRPDYWRHLPRLNIHGSESWVVVAVVASVVRRTDYRRSCSRNIGWVGGRIASKIRRGMITTNCRFKFFRQLLFLHTTIYM